MSLILAWENPQEAYDPVIDRVEVWRSTPDVKARQFRICADAPWGVYEDVENNNVDETYTIHYVRASGSVKPIIYDRDIRRMVRPIDLCKLTFSLRDPNGFPSTARTIEISNEPTGSDFYHRVLTNLKGYAEFFAVQGKRILIRIDGRYDMLDCVVPAKSEANWDELRANGTLLPTDPRGQI